MVNRVKGSGANFYVYSRILEFNDDYFWITPVMFLNFCKR